MTFEMTEEMVERVCEREMNRLDKELLSGSITQEEYDREVAELDKWARQELRG